MREAMAHAGLPMRRASPGSGATPARYLGFVEVHIEQGPVLNALDLPLGVVTSINGSARFLGEFTGMASHAGTTPMGQPARRGRRRGRAACSAWSGARSAEPDLVATVGMLEVPNGSINVVPGRARFSLDMRATTDPVRDALRSPTSAPSCDAHLRARAASACTWSETVRVAAAPSAPAWQARWEAGRAGAGPAPATHAQRRRPRRDEAARDPAAGHALLRAASNAGISHNPLESTTSRRHRPHGTCLPAPPRPTLRRTA
jgi:N-carbamoyl-L-amino-acid hydrolase